MVGGERVGEGARGGAEEGRGEGSGDAAFGVEGVAGLESEGVSGCGGVDVWSVCCICGFCGCRCWCCCLGRWLCRQCGIWGGGRRFGGMMMRGCWCFVGGGRLITTWLRSDSVYGRYSEDGSGEDEPSSPAVSRCVDEELVR